MDTTLTKYLSETTDTNNYLVQANNSGHQYLGDFEGVYDCYAANFIGEIKSWLQNKMLCLSSKVYPMPAIVKVLNPLSENPDILNPK